MDMVCHRFQSARIPGKPARTGARRAGLLALLAGLCLLAPAAALAQDYFLGEIIATPYNFAPTGWAFCRGQLLPISQNTALFSLLGTTFGGDGKSTFALPDLQGRITIGEGQGPGLSMYDLGEVGGEEFHTLTIAEMPAHSHLGLADSGAGGSTLPGGNYQARNAAGMPQYARTPSVAMSPAAIGMSGGGLPHENHPRYLTLNYIIAMQGIFPSRPAPTATPQAPNRKPAPSGSSK